MSIRSDREDMRPLTRGDATVDIPLEQVGSKVQPVSYPYSTYTSNGPSPSTEKTGFFNHRPHLRGRRHSKPLFHRRKVSEDEEDSVTTMGQLYKRFFQFSILTRYLLYVIPVGILIAIPIVIGAIVKTEASIGSVRLVWFFVWVECCWVGLWVSKLVAHFLPKIFQAVCGVISAGTRKYSLVLKKLEIPLSLVGWALASLATFIPIMTRNPDQKNSDEPRPEWFGIVNRILAAALISSLIFLGERLFIQLVTINYHHRQFKSRIKKSKHQIYLLSLLYESSREMFPQFCPEFQEEDAVISDTLDQALAEKTGKRGKKKGSAHRSGSSTPMRVLRDVGRMGDKLAAAFGNVAQEVTGKTMFNTDSAHAVVIEALEKNRSSEALARRLWLSFVIEGNEALYPTDIAEVLGEGRHAEADECFAALDQDGNGDVSLDEMILTVSQWGRDRHSIANSMHDVDQAIKVLDRMLSVVVFVVVVFVFVGFLNTSFVTTLATTGTALISLSFVFAVTAQEILGSCIFLFVKHPFDIGDRIDMNYGTDKMVVEHISLLFTVFRRVDNHRTVQIPNILLNTVWIENVSRSNAMKEQLNIIVSFDTSLEDIQLLRKEMLKFVTDPNNSRDFQPEIEIEVTGINEMDKLTLCVEIAHKSNWANESVRAARRSKFMCALVLALRRVPIYAPGGGDPAVGSSGNPAYSVTVSDADAADKRDKATKEKEDKRLVPTVSNKSDGSSPAAKEAEAVNALNERRAAVDPARDAGTDRGNVTLGTPKLGESDEIEEVRGLLLRETSKGKRKSGWTAGDLPTSELAGPTTPTASSHTFIPPVPSTPTSRGSPALGPQIPQIGITAPSPRFDNNYIMRTQSNESLQRSEDEPERDQGLSDFPRPALPPSGPRFGPYPPAPPPASRGGGPPPPQQWRGGGGR